jgi:hypothetical protein
VGQREELAVAKKQHGDEVETQQLPRQKNMFKMV